MAGFIDSLKRLFSDRRFLIAIFIILLLYGGLIRVWNLGGKSFWIDESISAISARAITEQGAPRLGSGFMYDRALGFHYLMSFFLLFGESEANARLISVIFGLATCVLIFFIGRLYSRETGWLAFVLSLFMEIFIVHSREARMYQMEMLFFFLSLYLLYRSLSDRRFFLWGLLCFLIAYETHVIALLLFPLLAYAGYKLLRKEGFTYSRGRKLFFWIASGLLLIYLLYRYSYMISEFRFSYITLYLGHLKYYAPFLLLAIIGFALSWKKKISLILAGALLLNLLAGGLNITFGYRYIYLSFLPAVVLSAVALSRIKMKWTVTFIYIMWLSNLFTPLTYTFVVTPMESISNYDPTAPRLNFRPLYEELSAIYDGETFVASFGPPAEWYFKKPDYWTYFSMSGYKGRERNESLYLGKDVYTGADVLYNLTDFLGIEGEKIVVAGAWSVMRIDSGLREYFVTNCTEIINKEDISAFRCP